MVSQTTVLCFGEVLWDCTPQGLFLGGAPMNVAYHVNVFGDRALPVTAVGDDFLGTEIKRRFLSWGIATDLVATVGEKQTGVVQVDLTKPADPIYEILDNVAWDEIPLYDGVLVEAKKAAAIVYGSLALRHQHNRSVLREILSNTAGRKVFDVNIRPPFYELPFLINLAEQADLIKMNRSELSLMHPGIFGSIAEQAESFSRTVGCHHVCVTCGSAGAGMWDGANWHWQAAQPISGAGDAVGAGDSFLAGLIHSLLAGLSADDGLRVACRLAEFVAGSDGATPVYNPASFW